MLIYKKEEKLALLFLFVTIEGFFFLLAWLCFIQITTSE